MHIIESISEISQEQNFPIFFWDKWKTVENKLHHKQRFLCADDEGNVVAFTVYTMKFFKKADYLYVPLDKNGERLSVEKEKRFLDEFHKYLKCEKYADVIFPPSHIETFKAIPDCCLYYKLGMMKVDLSKDVDEILSKLHKENRRQLRRAEDRNLEILEGLSCIKSFYEIYDNSANYKDFQPLPFCYFENLGNMISENVFCACVMCEEQVEAAYFCLKDVKRIYPLYSGTSFKPQFKGSKKYLLWNIYMKSQKEGIKEYVSGGYRYGLSENDPLHNVHLFKLGMGAEIEDGYHFIKVINPVKYAVVNFAMECKSLLTGKDCSFVNLKGLEVKKSK